MKKYFGSAFIAAIGFVSLASGAALAHTTGRQPAASEAKDALPWVSESGTASYYGIGYHGHRSASGARYDQMQLTAAHPWLPFGTKVRVTLAGTDRSVVVTITDRLHCGNRIVDLSVAAARELGMISRGIATVTLLPA